MTDLNAMWEALEKYQQFADADGHGESWRVMCEKQTEKAAWAVAEHFEAPRVVIQLTARLQALRLSQTPPLVVMRGAL
jgi:hypothetical protein